MFPATTPDHLPAYDAATDLPAVENAVDDLPAADDAADDLPQMMPRRFRR